MDSSANSQNASSSSIRKRNPGDEESMTAIQSKRAKFLQTYRRQQPFAFPDSIMHYIAKNPSSPEIYAKMIQACKYFFIKNPVLLISDLLYQNGWEATYNGKRTNIDLDKITSKLWIIDGLDGAYQKTNLSSTILPKIYQCHAKILTLRYQNLSYNELIALTSKAERICLDQVTVKYEYGSIVPFEKLFEAFPKVKRLYFTSPSVSSITAQSFVELLKIPHFSTLEHCMIHNITEDFDIDNFYDYMKKNKCTRFLLKFSDSISDAFKTRIEEIVDEILGTQIHNYKLPFIRFPGLDFDKVVKLYSLSRQQ